MDLAMRVARYFPMFVLTGFILPAALPLAASASDSAAVETTDQPSEPQNRGRIVDEAVQQANYYDSRPRPNATSISPGNSTSDRNGALFHGDSFHFPNLLFGRQTKNNRPANYSTQPPQSSQSASNQSKPTIASKVRQQVAGQPSDGAGRPIQQNPMQQRTVQQNPTQQRMMQHNMVQQGSMQPRAMQSRTTTAAPPAVANSNFKNPNGRNLSSQPPMPIYQADAPHAMPLAARPVAATSTNIQTSSTSPWTMPPASATPAKPAGPLTPGDRLVAQAHALSTAAKTEQDYTHIIETCRRAQASQVSPETIKYANTLTAWAFNRRGQLKAEEGRDKDAILDFDDAIRVDSTCWRALHNRGVLLAQAGQFEKAFDDFSRTIQLNSKFAKAYSNRAALFMVANNLNGALQDYHHAIELDANLAVAHRGCGRVCQLLGRLDEADQHYDAAVQLAPTDAYAAACRADLLTDVGRYSDALAEYNRALKLDPKSSQANCGSAWLLATCPDSALRNPELAVERAKQSIEIGGQKDAISFDSLAAAQASAGDFAAAMQSIHKAIELAPADERDTYNERLAMYQKAKPYRIAPVERVAQQASYQTK